MSPQGLSQVLTDEQACDQEPIRYISSIQAHGCLIAFSWPDRRVQVVSDNIELFLARAKSEIVGSKLDYIFESKFLDELADQVRTYPWMAKGVHITVRAVVSGTALDAYLFESQGLFVLEFERYDNEVDRVEERSRILKDYLLQAKGILDLAKLSKVTCQAIRALTGLDRVMVYRFIPPSWHGEVIGEDRVTSAPSYLGHRFPASDIPRPARELYLRNSVRLIADVNSVTHAIEPALNPKTKQPMDLSDSRLRASSPIHIEYLKNMGVAASFSVAIGTSDTLWGLITCHHMTSISLSQAIRTACEIVANTFAIEAPLLETVNIQNEKIGFESQVRKILEGLKADQGNLSEIFKRHLQFTQTFRAMGMALVEEKLLDLAGMTPRTGDIEDIAEWVKIKMRAQNSPLFVTDELGILEPKFAELKGLASGVLAIALPSRPEALVLLFRPEEKQTLTWGGDPRKQLEKREFGGKLNPRMSFKAWDEVIDSHSLEWRDYEIDGMKFLCNFIK